MNAAAAIKTGLDMGEFVSLAYLGDLSDHDLLQRPAQGCNHIAWQLGHLIASEHQMINACFPGTMPPLPAGFAEKYAKQTADSDRPADFHSKEELLGVYRAQRAATLAKLATLADSAFDAEATEAMRSYAPTVGAVFSMQGSHWLMHAGQWAVLRRQLSRAPLF
ncbi:MAG: DinB family protein [Planctomycetota bacterium]